MDNQKISELREVTEREFREFLQGFVERHSTLLHGACDEIKRMGFRGHGNGIQIEISDFIFRSIFKLERK